MAGKAVLTCRPNSHPFQERTLTLEQPAKIGRSVARSRPAPNNAIFDCKVLSRNHALFWYTNGKFYLQDTKSSNGTYVNNQRLSKSGEQSAPREVCSGDIVQFGVDVLENSRKVTHGCIIANLKLYLPDGKEAKASNASSVSSSPGTLPVEDLYQLNQYIQEAIQREQNLESKLFSLQTVLDNIREATDQSWKALISEDRLLSRVEILENQLQTYSKNLTEDNLREELRKLQEDKCQYQTTAKDFLKKVLEEKVEAVQKCQEVKRSLMNLEAEYSNLCDQMSKSNRDINDLAQKLSTQLTKNDELESKLQEIEEQHEEKVEYLEAKIVEMEGMLEKQHATEASLERQVSELEVAGHLAKKRASAYELQLKALNNVPLNTSEDGSELQNNISVGNSYEENSKDENDVTCIKVEDQRINSWLEEQRKSIEVLDLFTAQLNLLQSEKRPKLQQMNLQDEWEDFGKNTHLEKNSSGTSEDIVMRTEVPQDEIEDSSSDFQSSQKQSEISSDGHNSSYHELKRDGDPCDGLNKNEVSQSGLPLNENCLKPERGIEDKDEQLLEDLRDVNRKILEDIEKENRKILEDIEKERLKKQLVETQQSAKQYRNEAAQMANKVKLLIAELDLRNSQDDNKTKEELEETKEECSRLVSTVSSLQLQVSSLEENLALFEEEKRLSENPLNTLESEMSNHVKDLQTKVRKLEEELVIVSTRYMMCNEERTILNRDLEKLKLDYQAVTHQPYFNLIFALPCIVLFVAIIVAFYPTLSRLTGTSDYPQHMPE